MRKRYLAILMTVALVMSLSGCGTTSTTVTTAATSTTVAGESTVANATTTVSGETTTAEEGVTTEANAATTVEGETTAVATGLSDTKTYAPDFTTLQHRTDATDAPAVYMTTDITPAGLQAVYQALGREATGKVAVKLSTGEAGNNHYLSPDLIKDLVQSVNGTIVECNTAYGGSRAETALHRQVIEDHGFSAIANVDIMDENGSMSIPVTGGTYMTENLVGANLANYDFVMVLSHFKGHAMGGFGGAIKNISIGIASSEGKNIIHTGGTSHDSWMSFASYAASEGDDHNKFLSSMAESAKAVSDYEGNGSKMLYISVLNHLSVDCDCDGNPSEPDMHDIGIAASLDPVALDQACVDMIYAAPEGASLIERMESRNAMLTLEHAQEIGLGNRTYSLVSVE